MSVPSDSRVVSFVEILINYQKENLHIFVLCVYTFCSS